MLRRAVNCTVEVGYIVWSNTEIYFKVSSNNLVLRREDKGNMSSKVQDFTTLECLIFRYVYKEWNIIHAINRHRNRKLNQGIVIDIYTATITFYCVVS